MDLYCCESSANEVKAYDDPTLLQDRVLRNLLKTEDRYVLPYTSCFAVQQEVTPEMRKIVAEWMMEVRTPAQLIRIYIYNSNFVTLKISKFVMLI